MLGSMVGFLCLSPASVDHPDLFLMQTRPHQIRSTQFGADQTISCHSQPCQFVYVHAPAAYGGNMLSGELVSWPGLPSPGTDGGSLGPEEQLCC